MRFYQGDHQGASRVSAEEIMEEAKFYRSQRYRAYKIRCGGGAYDDGAANRLKIDEGRVAAARRLNIRHIHDAPVMSLIFHLSSA